MNITPLFNKLAVPVLTLGAVMMTSCSNNTSGTTYSEGHRAGVVTSIKRTGVFNKSWEGELAMENMRVVDSAKSTNIFNFAVKDEDTAVISQLQGAMESGKRVNLHYKEVLNHNPMTATSDHFVDGVKYAPRR